RAVAIVESCRLGDDLAAVHTRLFDLDQAATVRPAQPPARLHGAERLEVIVEGDDAHPAAHAPPSSHRAERHGAGREFFRPVGGTGGRTVFGRTVQAATGCLPACSFTGRATVGESTAPCCFQKSTRSRARFRPTSFAAAIGL